MKKNNILRIIFTVIELIVLWQLLSIAINRDILPPPIAVIKEFVSMLNGDREIYVHILSSLKRIILGMFFGIMVAIPTGIILGNYKKINYYFGKAFDILYITPKIVFLPIIIIILGIGDLAKIFLIAIIVFFQQTVVIRDAVELIPVEYFRLIGSMGAKRFQSIRLIVFPSITPAIITALRATIGTAIALLFIAESFASFSGMGYYITSCMSRRNYLSMYSAIFLLAIIGIILYGLVDLLEKIVCKWEHKRS